MTSTLAETAAIWLDGRAILGFVPVPSDSQKLQINSSRVSDRLFVGGAMPRNIFGQSIWEMDVTRFQVHLGKEMVLHERPIGRGVMRGQADILIKVEGSETAKIERLSQVFGLADE